MSRHNDALEYKLTALIKESNRLYDMLDQCVKSRERLQKQVLALQERLLELEAE